MEVVRPIYIIIIVIIIDIINNNIISSNGSSNNISIQPDRGFSELMELGDELSVRNISNRVEVWSSRFDNTVIHSIFSWV